MSLKEKQASDTPGFKKFRPSPPAARGWPPGPESWTCTLPSQRAWRPCMLVMLLGAHIERISGRLTVVIRTSAEKCPWLTPETLRMWSRGNRLQFLVGGSEEFEEGKSGWVRYRTMKVKESQRIPLPNAFEKACCRRISSSKNPSCPKMNAARLCN